MPLQRNDNHLGSKEDRFKNKAIEEGRKNPNLDGFSTVV